MWVKLFDRGVVMFEFELSTSQKSVYKDFFFFLKKICS